MKTKHSNGCLTTQLLRIIKAFLLIRVWEYNKIENKTMEIMRMIPGHNKKIIKKLYFKRYGWLLRYLESKWH